MKPLSNAWFAEMRRRLDKAKAINEAYRPRKEGGKEWEFTPVERESVGRFTGLRDKNGREIYEGDICRVVNNPLVPPDAFAVVWNEEFASWMWKDNRSEDYFNLAIANGSEVIGNIHDNPELLTKEAP